MPRTTIERKCAVCGTAFQVAPSRLKHGRGVHCSKACQYIANRDKLQKPKLSLTCIGCGVVFERLESRLDRAGGGKFCTRECRDEHWKGELNPNWQDGTKVYKRGPRWQSIKRAILRRDDYECQECGVGGDLHVHHKTPFRMFDDADKANHEDNLISLCPPCHRKEDAKYKWAKVDGVAIRMNAGSAEWDATRLQLANDNSNREAAA